MRGTTRFAAVAAAGLAALLALTACAGGSSGSTSTEAGPVTEGKLTIATGEPAYGPWVIDNKPESGEGFESAVAYAVAEKLGYKKDDVVWVRSTFDAAIAPGPKGFDLNIQQFSVTPERAKAVDFSTPYYQTTQAVVATKNSKVAGAKSVADLKDATIGVMSGTTSLKAAEDVIAPSHELQVFNDNVDAVGALKTGQIDALVVDLPAAFFIRDTQLDEQGVILGQLDAAAGDEFAFVLPKGSSLTKKVDEALAALQADGKLDEIKNTWLAGQGAPNLK